MHIFFFWETTSYVNSIVMTELAKRSIKWKTFPLAAHQEG